MCTGQSLFLLCAGHCCGGLINIYSSQLGKEMSGRGEGPIVTAGSDTNKPAGSFLPHWRLKTQYTIGCALGQSYSELGCFCVWVSDGEDETESKGTGGRGTAKKKPTERDTGPEFKLKKGKCFWKGEWRRIPFESCLHDRPPAELTRQWGKEDPQHQTMVTKRREALMFWIHMSPPGFTFILTHSFKKETEYLFFRGRTKEGF